MNHPKREEWVPYLFGETKPEHRRELQQHLQDCEPCRTEVDRWKRTLGQLNSWKLVRCRSYEGLPSVFRWAFASALVLVLAIGLAVGRLTSRDPGTAKLREAIESKVREDLRADFAQLLREELATTAAATLATSERQTKNWLAEYARGFNARIQTERAERIADTLALKREVDTIAINADAGLRDAEKWLVQLANFRQANRSPN